MNVVSYVQTHLLTERDVRGFKGKLFPHGIGPLVLLVGPLFRIEPLPTGVGVFLGKTFRPFNLGYLLLEDVGRLSLRHTNRP